DESIAGLLALSDVLVVQSLGHLEQCSGAAATCDRPHRHCSGVGLRHRSALGLGLLGLGLLRQLLGALLGLLGLALRVRGASLRLLDLGLGFLCPGLGVLLGAREP